MNILTISLMNSCNRDCYYCPVKKWLRPLNREQTDDDKKNNRPLVNQLNNRDLLKFIFKNIKPSGWVIELTGGEPGLYPEIDELLMELTKKKYQGMVKTNGSCEIKSTDNFPLVAAWHEGEKIPANYDQILIIKNPADDWRAKTTYCEENGIPYHTVGFDRKFEGVKAYAEVFGKINRAIRCAHVNSSGRVTECAAAPPDDAATIWEGKMPTRNLQRTCLKCKNIHDVELWLSPAQMEVFEADYIKNREEFSKNIIKEKAAEPRRVKHQKTL